MTNLELRKTDKIQPAIQHDLGNKSVSRRHTARTVQTVIILRQGILKGFKHFIRPD